MFSQQIKLLRKEKNISQKKLAEDLSLTQQAIGKWETGKSTPDGDMLKILSDYFSVSIDYMLGRKSVDIEGGYSQELIPIIGTVKAGYNAIAFTEDYGYEYANVSNPENYFYLIVKGDSMEPRISDGDLALVKKQDTLNDGELGVILYNDEEATLKKFVRKGNTVILQAFNPQYESRIFVDEELNSLRIAGKVVETKVKW